MGKLKKQAEAQAAGAPPTITAGNYVARAKAFIIARGKGTVIWTTEHNSRRVEDLPEANEAQWRAWLNYFDALGYPTVFARSVGVITVPTNWPEEFDQNALPSNRDPMPSPPKRKLAPPMPQIAARWQSMRSQIAKASHDRAPIKTPETALEELKEYYQENPVTDAPKFRESTP